MAQRCSCGLEARAPRGELHDAACLQHALRAVKSLHTDAYWCANTEPAVLFYFKLSEYALSECLIFSIFAIRVLKIASRMAGKALGNAVFDSRL